MKDVNVHHYFQSTTGGGEQPAPLYETYHLNSSIERCDTPFFRRILEINTSDIGRQMASRAAKNYACAERTPLPPLAFIPSMSLVEAIRQRQSSLRFFGGQITLEELSVVVKMGNGLTGVERLDGLPRRAIPSGGALYPTELYVLPLEVEGLSPGAYHYDIFAHALAQFHRKPAEPMLAAACFNELAVVSASVALVISCCFERQLIKYDERAYRFALLEAGHVAQNVLLTAAAMGLATLPVGGFLDRDVNQYLELDGLSEAAIYVLFLGHELSADERQSPGGVASGNSPTVSGSKSA